MRVFVDIRTNRVVYFTDSEEHLHPDQNTAQVDYLGDWPAEITHRNCWNWVLEDRNLVNIPDKAKFAKQSLIDTNRIATETLLRRKINEKRQSLTSAMHYEESIQVKKVREAQDYLSTKKSSFLLTRLSALNGVELPEMANTIIDEWTAKERALMQTEVQLTEFLKRLADAPTSEEVIAIHAEIVKL